MLDEVNINPKSTKYIQNILYQDEGYLLATSDSEKHMGIQYYKKKDSEKKIMERRNHYTSNVQVINQHCMFYMSHAQYKMHLLGRISTYK